jgi:hypothetical protein
MPQIGSKKYAYTRDGLAKYKHDLRKLSLKKKKIQKQYGMSANMDQFQFANVSGVPSELKKMLKGEQFDPSNPRHVALMLKFKKIKAKGMEKHLSANMNHLISLEAKMDSTFEFYAQEKKERSTLGTVAKVGALGGAAYGGSLLLRGNKLKGGMKMPPKKNIASTAGPGTGAFGKNPAPKTGPLNKASTMLGKAKKTAQDAGGAFKKAGGAKGMLSRAGAVMKKDKNLLGGFARKLFRR